MVSSSMWNRGEVLFSVLLIHLLASSCDARRGKQKVCVIGAGPAGLTSAKQLADNRDKFDIVVFEKSSEVASFWNYTNKAVDEHNLPVQSSIYKSLRINGPKELMAYPDYRSFTGEDRSCVTHETTLDYFKNFTNHFNLRQYIKFNTLVENLTTYTVQQITTHVITTRNLNTNKTLKTTCDAVMICHGNNVTPNIPKIPGLDGFSGIIMHSHNYRVPKPFAGQTVVVLGASDSGIDISIDISKTAKKVYLSHNHAKNNNTLPSNIEQVSGVAKAVGNTLILRDGSNITVDAFVFCTGYIYDIPFLDKKNKITVERKFVHPLYNHIVNVEYPTIGIIGLPAHGIGFPAYYVQAKYFVALLKGDVTLPDKEIMLKIVMEERMQRLPHDLTENRWAYYDQLAEDGHFEQLPKYYENGSKNWAAMAHLNWWHFKDFNAIILENDDVQILYPNGTTFVIA